MSTCHESHTFFFYLLASGIVAKFNRGRRDATPGCSFSSLSILFHLTPSIDKDIPNKFGQKAHYQNLKITITGTCNGDSSLSPVSSLYISIKFAIKNCAGDYDRIE